MFLLRSELYVVSPLLLVLCFVGYVACLYPFYVLCTILLKLSSATIFDLCVLCANVYNLLFGIFLFSNKVRIIYSYIRISYSYRLHGSPLVSVYGYPNLIVIKVQNTKLYTNMAGFCSHMHSYVLSISSNTAIVMYVCIVHNEDACGFCESIEVRYIII